MPIRIYWAPPGPEAEEALTQYWRTVYEIVDEILLREKKLRDQKAGREGLTEPERCADADRER